MKKILLLAAFAASGLFAQSQEIVHVKNADVDRIAKIVSSYGANIVSDGVLRVIAVKGNPENVQAVVAAIKSLDQPEPPQPNVELTIYLLFGSSKEAVPDAVPQDLASTVKQLKALFPYKSYKVMDSWLTRSRDRQNSENSGTLPGTQINYQFHVTPSIGPTSGGPRSVRLGNLRLGLQIPNETHTNFVTAGINTDLDAKEGQKTVVGKSNISGTEDALILVVIPKVIE